MSFGVSIGYVPKCLPAKREEIRTIVHKVIENLRTFGKGEPNLDKIWSFLVTQEVILSLLICGCQVCPTGKRKAHLSYDWNPILLLPRFRMFSFTADHTSFSGGISAPHGYISKLCLTLCDPIVWGIQAPLSSSVSWSLLKFMSVESVIRSSHLILFTI